MYILELLHIWIMCHIFIQIHSFAEDATDLIGESHDAPEDDPFPFSSSGGNNGEVVIVLGGNISSLGDPGLASRDGCSCGQRNYQGTRILAGTTSKINEFPWRCYFRMGVDGSGFCGCTLISNKWVMTAAHCITRAGPATVFLGDHKIRSGPPVTIVLSKRIVVHPRYNGRTIQNDIALIELRQAVSFSEKVSPACLPWYLSSTQIRPGGRVVTSGWGLTSLNNPRPLIQHKVDMTLINFHQCSRHYRNMLYGDMICAGGSRGEAICQGDSGGSLDMRHNGHYYAIGISSWGTKTCRGYSVFSRVTYFLSWIQQTTGDTFCKL